MAASVLSAAAPKVATAADGSSALAAETAVAGNPYQVRIDAALAQAEIPLPRHRNNGDERRYATRFASFSKGLPCDALGEVLPDAYAKYLAALRSGNPADFLLIPLGGQTKLANPQGAFAAMQEGAEASAVTLPPAPMFGTLTETADGLEVYWQALTRDVPFSEYAGNPLIAAAVADLRRFTPYRTVSAGTIFRGVAPGVETGPYVSQFLFLDIPFDNITIQQLYRRPEPGSDFMTSYDEWLAIQNGVLPTRSAVFQPGRGYILNGRDLAEYVHSDFSYQAFLSAALILLGYGRAALDEANPYLNTPAEGGFLTFGGPAILDLVARVSTAALKAAWFQKWRVHRRLRPEAWAGRVHNHISGAKAYPFKFPNALLNSPALDEVYSRHGTYLLPMAYPEGSPTHPAYPAGHSTISGACVTILKAFFKEQFVLPAPVLPAANGQSLVSYTGPDLTIGGELNKLAANITFGRDTAGVHWRTDGRGLLLGEEVAIRMLADFRRLNNEVFNGFTLTRFDGTTITV